MASFQGDGLRRDAISALRFAWACLARPPHLPPLQNAVASIIDIDVPARDIAIHMLLLHTLAQCTQFSFWPMLGFHACQHVLQSDFLCFRPLIIITYLMRYLIDLHIAGIFTSSRPASPMAPITLR